MRSTLALLLAAALSALAGAAAPPAGAAAPCSRTGDTKHVVAVFGYRASQALARRLERQVEKAFDHVSTRRVDCGLWQVFVDGLDTRTQQRGFAAEAVASGWQVSYDTVHGVPVSKPGQVRAIFGSFPTVAAADERLQQVAAVGFRIANVFRRGNRFTVEVLHIPLAGTQPFARAARSAKLDVRFEP